MLAARTSLALIFLFFICMGELRAQSPDASTQTLLSNDAEPDIDRDSSSNRPENQPAADKVAQLIGQLRSPSFSERQFATEQLWQMGRSVIHRLEEVQNDPDPEVAKRIKGLIEAMRHGVDASTPKSTAMMILYFKNGESEVREQIIRNLELQNNYELVFELIDSLENKDLQRQLYNEEIELDSTVFRLALLEKWQTLDAILTHDLAWPSHIP